ncbi:Outer membrane protein A precursor [Candidatus Phaeomarinobacter ectocarpi]|uniref:Outer membrane protein A n=1 Tax=Candidatus Phaeomarinibacter ectocarpi TaxID=1458461 RepID=X5MMT5_9HYPH|nr:OmpA family protein [Candidatus Phaeomarinobacter ectocarpi]CDO59516.1 Outer membrane protein A precursor [Candidatus Phaeomarinobacter ectocarpi]
MNRPDTFLRSAFVGLFALVALPLMAVVAAAEDVDGSEDHPALSRYPGSVIAWYDIENYMPYRVPVGPETGYRAIEDWVETEGRVTRIYYRTTGERTYQEIWKNYRDAIEAAGFEILAVGLDAKSTEPGGRSWTGTLYRENPWDGGTGEPVGEIVKGTSSSGGRGVVVAKKDRAEGPLYLVVSVYQYSAEQVSTLVDVIEEEAAETGLVTANAEAIGKDMTEFGRVVLDGLYFDHNKATLTSASEPSLVEIAKFLTSAGDTKFFVVGHTDLTGGFDYNSALSRDRAAAVADALVSGHGIDPARLSPHGVGPLVPVFTNASDAGRGQNRRVELVQASVPAGD